MKDIVISKTSDAAQRIVLQTDTDSPDYQTRFTIMTISGSIEGVALPFSPGSVTSLYEISQFLANNEDMGISVDVMSDDVKPETVEPAVPQILSADLYYIFDEASFKNYAGKEYNKNYPYETQKQYLPWIRFTVKKSVEKSSFDLEISHDGTACPMDAFSAFGVVSGNKVTFSDYDSLMLDPKTDLKQENIKGTYLFKFTMGTQVVQREYTIE